MRHCTQEQAMHVPIAKAFKHVLHAFEIKATARPRDVYTGARIFRRWGFRRRNFHWRNFRRRNFVRNIISQIECAAVIQELTYEVNMSKYSAKNPMAQTPFSKMSVWQKFPLMKILFGDNSFRWKFRRRKSLRLKLQTRCIPMQLLRGRPSGVLRWI